MSATPRTPGAPAGGLSMTRLTLITAIVVVVGCAAAVVVLGIPAGPANPDVADELIARLVFKADGTYRLEGARPGQAVATLHTGRWAAPPADRLAMDTDLRGCRNALRALVAGDPKVSWRDPDGQLMSPITLHMDPAMSVESLYLFWGLVQYPSIRASDLRLVVGSAAPLQLRSPYGSFVGGSYPPVGYDELRVRTDPTGDAGRTLDLGRTLDYVGGPLLIAHQAEHEPLLHSIERAPFPAGTDAANRRTRLASLATLSELIRTHREKSVRSWHVLGIKLLGDVEPPVRMDEALLILRAAVKVMGDPEQVMLLDPTWLRHPMLWAGGAMPLKVEVK